MSKHFTILIFLCLLTHFLYAVDKNPLDYFHICTISNKPHPNLDKLVQSCKAHKIDLDIIGMDLPYPSNGIKYIYMLNYLKKFKDYEIVMYVDAWDVLILDDKEVILSKFLETGAPILMAAETNCWPYYERAHEFPASPTIFKYVNTGTYIGHVKHLREWLLDLKPDPSWDDQAQTMAHYLKNLKNNKTFFVFDYYCELFLPLWALKENDVVIDEKQKKVYCCITGSTPSVIHANGGSFVPILNKVYETLFAH